MVCRIDLGVHRRDFPLLVDQIADARRVAWSYIAASAISHPNLALGVAQQRERETVLPGECRVGRYVIEADTEDDDAAIFERAVLVAEPATLSRSAASVGFGIEPQ